MIPVSTLTCSRVNFSIIDGLLQFLLIFWIYVFIFSVFVLIFRIRIRMSFIGQVCLHVQGICNSDRSSTVQQNDSDRTGHRKQKNNIHIYRWGFSNFVVCCFVFINVYRFNSFFFSVLVLFILVHPDKLNENEKCFLGSYTWNTVRFFYFLLFHVTIVFMVLDLVLFKYNNPVWQHKIKTIQTATKKQAIIDF